jgi:hypothetical protein
MNTAAKPRMPGRTGVNAAISASRFMPGPSATSSTAGNPASTIRSPCRFSAASTHGGSRLGGVSRK